MLLVGGKASLRDDWGSELSAIVAGGPANPPRAAPAAGGAAPAGAANCQSLAATLI
jgi:hypothetical protein